MTSFNKILLGVLALQLVLAVVLRRGDAEPGIPPLVNVVGKLEAGEVTKIALFDKRKAGDAAPTAPKIELTRAGAGWVMSSAYGYPVDGKKVDDLVGKLEKPLAQLGQRDRAHLGGPSNDVRTYSSNRIAKLQVPGCVRSPRNSFNLRPACPADPDNRATA